jgi:WD40 repeat protein
MRCSCHCFLILVLPFLLLSCSRFGNDLRSFGVECGGETSYDSRQELVFQIQRDGRPLDPAEVDLVTLNGGDIKSRLSSKACFSLRPDEGDVLAVTHKDGKHAAVLNAPMGEREQVNRIPLEPMKPINWDPKDKDLVFRDFCSDTSQTLYLPTQQLSFVLNFSPLTRKTILSASGRITQGEGTQLAELVTQTRLVEPRLETFTLDMPANSPSVVEIEVTDVFGNRITSPSCKVHVTPKAPGMKSVAGSPYFPHMYVRSKTLESMEFSMNSEAPIRKLDIQYIDAQSGEQDESDSFVPFPDKDGSWKVLAPLPKLSGLKNLVLTLESMSGFKVREHAVLNFGEKKYVPGGVKLAITSRNEKFMLLGSYTGLLKVLDLTSDEFIYEKKFDDDIKYADITNDGRTVILGLASKDLMINILKRQEIQPEAQFSKLGFYVTKDQKTIIGTHKGESLVWLDIASGRITRQDKLEKSSMEYWRVSEDESTAFMLAGNKQLFVRALDQGAALKEVESPCVKAQISHMEISKSADFVILACSSRVYFKSLKNPEEKPRNLLEFNTSAWSLALSPDNEWVAAGSMSGEWYAVHLKTGKSYPGNELESLRKGYKFKTTVNILAFSDDGKFLLAGTEDGTSKVYSFDDEDFVEAIKADSQILTLGFLNARKKFYVGSLDGLLRRQDIHSPLYGLNLHKKVESMALHGETLAIGTSPRPDDASEEAAGTSLFNIRTREFLGLIPHTNKVNTIAFSPDGANLLTASEDGTAKLGSVSSPQQALSIGLKHREPGRAVRAASLSKDGQSLLIVSTNLASAYRLNDYENPLLTIRTPEWISQAHFSNDQRYISTAAADNVARIHDAKDGKILANYTARNWVWDADLTPDLTKFVNLNGDRELVIQSTERDEKGTITGLTAPFKVPLPNGGGEYMALSPDSSWAAVSLWNGQAFMINLKDRFSYEMKCLPATQAMRPVFSHDSRFVALGQGNAAMVYQVQDGRPIQRAYHADRVTSVAFHKDQLISGSWDGKVRITKIDEASVVDCTSE